MSLTGTTATFIPYTLDGLQDLTVSSTSVDTIQVNSLTPNRVVVADGANYLVSAGATTTEVDYLSGATSNLQTQINGKASTTYVDTNFLNKTTVSSQTVAGPVSFQQFTSHPSIVFKNTGGNSFQLQANEDDELEILSLANAPDKVVIDKTGKIFSSALIASKALVSDANGKIVSSGVDASKIDYLDNVSSDIQTQLNGKVSKAGDTMTGTLDMGSDKITTTYVPVNNEDLANKAYVDSVIPSLSGYVPYTGATTAVDLGVNKITTTYVPVNNEDLINKAYADSAYATTAALAGYLPLAGGSMSGDIAMLGNLITFKGSDIDVSMGAEGANSFKFEALSGGSYRTFEHWFDRMYLVGNNIPYAQRAANPSQAQMVIQNNADGERLLLGNYYTGGEGAGCFIQSSDFYPDPSDYKDHGTDLLLNPIGGNVGIGTTDADTNLNVYGKGKFHDGTVGVPAIGTNGGSGTRLVLWPGSAGEPPYALGINGGTLWYGTPSAAIHAWYTGTTERMRLTSAGNLGIGTNSPDLGILQVHNPGGANFLTLSNPNFTVGEYINLRFYHGNSGGNRNSYIQSSLPGGSVSWLRFFTSDSAGNVNEQMTVKESRVLITNKLNIGGDGDPTGTLQIRNPNNSYTHFGYSNNWNYIRGDTTIVDTDLRFNVAPLCTETVWNSTTRRLPLRNSSNAIIQYGDCSTWRHLNNGIGWTAGYGISNAFYKASGTSTVTIDLFASWWANSGSPFRKDIYLSIYSVGVFLGDMFISKGFNTLNNHETISLSWVFTNSQAFVTGWYDIYVYATGAGVTSDINDYIGWTVTVMG